MSRVLAALVAVSLIIAGVLVRNATDGDSPRADDGGSTTRVLCSTELAAACATLPDSRYEVVIEDAARTADRLSTDEAVAVDAWVVPQPWPAIVDDNRSRDGLNPRFDPTQSSIARSPLVALGGPALAGCDWRCIGDGDDRLGAAPAASGLGTLELGAAASGYFGGPGFATNDFDAPFRSWLAALTSRVSPTDQPVTRLLQSRAFFDVALSFEAEAKAALASASADRKAGLALQYPAPMAYLDVVAVTVGTDRGGDVIDLRSRMARALVDLGWQGPEQAPNGLPKAGVLVALQDLV